MVSYTRLLLMALIGVGTPAYLVLQGTMEIGIRISSGVVLMALLALFVFSGRKPLPRSLEITNVEVSEVVEPSLVSPEESEIIVENEEKIVRRRARVATPAMPAMPAMPPSPLTNDLGNTTISATSPPSSLKNVAKKLVVETDAVSEMEGEIESYVKDRREKRAEIRSSIERRRRMALAERRAAKVRMWTDLEDGEDLGKILSSSGHDLEVIEENLTPDDSIPLGVSYVRIDEKRILKLRTPLQINEKAPESQTSDNLSPSEIPLPEGGMPPPPDFPGIPPHPEGGMPPPPDFPGMPPPPPPPL